MTESQNHKLVIEDSSDAAVLGMVDYIYTGKIPYDCERGEALEELFILADK